jgi:hypothetical protein
VLARVAEGVVFLFSFGKVVTSKTTIGKNKNRAVILLKILYLFFDVMACGLNT